MTIKERYQKSLEWLDQAIPEPKTELIFHDNYQLLVAVILSAQCTDKRVNMITPAFFEAFPTPLALSQATPEQVYELIKSCSYPNNKTKSLLGMAKTLVKDYGGEVPNDMDALLSLPGVGRKTANVILAVAYEKPAMAVDTHVFRVSERIGLTRGSKNPYQTEKTLMRHIPAELVPKAHHWLILHGRYVCKARNPQCSECGLKSLCRFYQQNAKAAAKEKDKPVSKVTEKKATAKKKAADTKNETPAK